MVINVTFKISGTGGGSFALDLELGSPDTFTPRALRGSEWEGRTSGSFFVSLLGGV